MRKLRQSNQSKLVAWVAIYAVGVLSGILVSTACRAPTKTSHLPSFVQPLDEVPLRKTSHNTDKQQLIEPFVVPNLAGISVARFQPNETVEPHQHDSMHEFFLVLEGELEIAYRDHANQVCGAGCFFHVAPHDTHSFVAMQPSRMLNVQLVVE